MVIVVYGGPVTTPTRPDDYIVLHSRDRLANDGVPVLTERFLSLDRRRARGQRTAVPGSGLTRDEGRLRLGDKYPDMAACVERCYVGPAPDDAQSGGRMQKNRREWTTCRIGLVIS